MDVTYVFERPTYLIVYRDCNICVRIYV